MVVPTKLALQVAERLKNKSIRFCHWKSNSHLVEGLAGLTDLDVLVDPAQSSLVAGELKGLGFIKVVSRPWNRYPQIEDWVGFDADTGALLHLHLHFVMATGLKYVKHLYIPWTNVLLDGVQPDKETGWMVPQPEMELLVLILRVWAKMPPAERKKNSPFIPTHVIKEIEWLRNKSDLDAFKKIAASLRVEVGDELVEKLFDKVAVSEADLIALGKIVYRTQNDNFRKSWVVARVEAKFMQLVQYASLFLIRYILPVQYRKNLVFNGLSIAFLGSDGSGKSTVSTAINKWLRFKIDSHCVYMGAGEGNAGFFNRLRIFSRKAVSGSVVNSSANQGKALTSSFLKKVYRLFYLPLVIRKFLLNWWGNRLVKNGSVVIMDRFPQMQFFEINDGPMLQNGAGFKVPALIEMFFFRKIIARPPSIIIRLNVTPEVALARKPDHSLDALIAKSALVKSIAVEGVKMYEINADKNYEEVLLEVKKIIWSQLVFVSDDKNN